MARTKAQFTPEGWAEYCKKTSIRQMMKRGKTREQAEAHYNQPLGVCSKCGKEAKNAKSRTCLACRSKQHVEALRVRVLTPEQKERHLRASKIRQMMKAGRTKEEAIADFEKPLGVCSRCGKKAIHSKARMCGKCRKPRPKAAQRKLTPERIAINLRSAAIRYHLRKGKTQEEAEAIVDKPQGICRKCSGPSSTKRGRLCIECFRKEARMALKSKKRTFNKTCPCGAAFVAKSFDRVYCDAHPLGAGLREAVVEPVEPKVSKPVKVTPVIPLPSKWNDPLPDHRKFAAPEPVAPVVVPAGFQVKRYDHTGALVSDLAQATRGLRDLFGSGRSAVD